ncbi:OLC1v1023631C1 [Oldenlandia corymbosa var. corymbosa]|uniref:OLC1v1023631C1 n=1 Tax=Oldenlandia corymbosa var. corymbosa TaxID=529605 RepID=A0AAV1C143_OLDCO|nr:OLC1v1023631C1 [Oldenlandia corymbosa var. corymbosa]
MIPLLFSGIIIITCAVIFVFGWRVLNWAWFEPKRLEKKLREQGFRGNPYQLIYGDFKEISSLFQQAHSKPINLSDDIVPRVDPHLPRTLESHGKMSYLWLGPKPALLIMEPDLIKEITNKYQVFHKPRSNPFFRLLAQGIFTYEGEKWANQRKLINPAFHVEKLKLMLPAFYESTNEMLSKWEEIASGKGGPIEVDVWPDLQTLTSDVISRTAFGSNYEEGKKIFELQKEQTELAMEASRSLYFPGLRFLPTKRNIKMRQIAREVNDSITEIINARLNSKQVQKEKYGEDLLGLLLESNSQANGNRGVGSSKLAMTINEVIEECKLFYFAGQETTSSLLVWTMILLSRYQDWQSRAREEVLHIFGTSKPDFDGLNHLKIVTMIMHEVLRLYPPLANLVRKTREETKLENLTLPAEVELMLPSMLIHRDPAIWGDDAKEFKPERFAEGVLHATKGRVVFFPFGWGPRICIGQTFAMLEAKLALSMILRYFSFELSPSYSHAPRSSPILQPQYGAHLILRKL